MTSSQDLHIWLDAYRTDHSDDVLEVPDEVAPDQGVTSIVWDLRAEGKAPIVVCPRVAGFDRPVVTNVFGSRSRVADLLGTDEDGLHTRFHELASNRRPMRVVDDGPVLAHVRTGVDLDVSALPMLTHFAQDAAPYWTSAVIVARDPATGIGNTSYHRMMVHSRTGLATSLHSRGDLWRYLQAAAERGERLPVAVVVGGHPLFLLACSARVGIDVDEREIAGGLFGDGLEVVRTPELGIEVPASSDLVLEGWIDPAVQVEEGPFGEFSGYASARSTNNLVEVVSILQREDPVLLDIVSGNAADHLNLGRIPRESDLFVALRGRYPEVTALSYPESGTHFHCYVSMWPRVPGQARQVLLALLGLDPYVKLAVAVDDDIDVRDASQVMWALATRFQADRDVITVSGVPGSMLDPSAESGMTSRMALDATKPPGFVAERISLDT
jgi:UbiD family decarboxylase